MAYAVPGTMQEVHVVLPYRHAGQYIQLRSSRTFREDSHGEVDMSFQYQGVVRLLFFGQFPQCDGAGDVGSAVQVLRTRVQQQESLGFQWHVRCRSGFVVYDGSMFLVPGNGVEAFPHVEWLCGTEFVQFLVYADFCLVACGNGLLQPFQELHQCHSVALHGCVDAGYFPVIADRFQQGYR